jgi:hypothetical protein
MIRQRPLALTATIAFTVVAAGFGLATPQRAEAAAPPTVDPVIEWNQTLLQLIRTPGVQPATVHPTRNLAIMHLAIYDAVNAIERIGARYAKGIAAGKHASAVAAADEAAHDTLVALYPTRQADLDSQLNDDLAKISNGTAKRQGVAIGQASAKAIVTMRTGDGSDASPPQLPAGTTPGSYRPTPPNFVPPAFTHWPKVTPIALTRANQFRPGMPPALTSATYIAALQEVQRLGDVHSTTRTADQTQIANFWAAPIQNYWNEIAQTAALERHTTLAQNARLFALLNASFADATIAFYDAKYTYDIWRPVTAIRAGDGDGNGAITADLNWTPLAGNTAPDPSYPGAHSTISADAAVILQSVFGTDSLRYSVRSEALPGVQRSFTSFSGAAQEAALSRIYAGQHTRVDHVAGVELGRSVAHYVLRHPFQRQLAHRAH